MNLKGLGTCFLLACVFALGATNNAYAQDDSEDVSTPDLLVELVVAAVKDNCTCPDPEASDAKFASFEKCVLKKQVKKALKAFKKGASYVDLSSRSLKSQVTSELNDYVEDCEAAAEEDEEDDSDSEDEFDGGDDAPPSDIPSGDFGGDEPPSMTPEF